MSKYKTWTPEDKVFLEEKWGEKPIGWIAGRLGRTEDAVVVMSRKMGLGPHLDAGDCISMNQLLYAVTGSKGCGSVTKRWIENGLPVKRHKVRRCYFRVISIDAFWKWAEAHKDLMNFKRFEELSLGREPAWVKVKRKADVEAAIRTKKNNNQPWTAAEDRKLQHLVDLGKTYPEIAAELRKTEGAVKRRIFDAGIRGRPARMENRRWTEEEAVLLVKLRESGLGWLQISEKLGRSQLAVRGKYERLLNPEYMQQRYRGKAGPGQYIGIRDMSAEEILQSMATRKIAQGGGWTELEEREGGDYDRADAI